MTTQTKKLDRFDNVTYEIHRDGVLIGVVAKACSGYRAEFLNDTYVPTTSIKKARALIEARA